MGAVKMFSLTRNTLFLVLQVFHAYGQPVETLPGQFPFAVSLQIPELGGHNCAGAIISKNWVLTTAYCGDTDDSLDHNNFIVVAGVWDINAKNESRQVRHVDRVYRHPYFSSQQSCDLALIRLSESFDMTSLSSIPLASMNQEFEGECTEIGWSQLAGGSRLQAGSPTYIDTEKCEANTEIGAGINFSTFCAIDEETNMAEMCPGYFGSPVVCTDGTQDVLAGFQSYTFACKTTGVPSTYAKVSGLRDWIDYILSKYPD